MIENNKKEDNKKILLKYLKNLNSTERDHFIFKLMCDGISKENAQLLRELIPNHPIIFRNFNYIGSEANSACDTRKAQKHNRNINPEIMSEYKELLTKMSWLAKELNIDSSLELSILYSYLLWKGYLSKTGEHRFDNKNRKFIGGLFFGDIVEGKGVCLDYSATLKDFLNHNGYNSTVLSNYYGRGNKIDYEIPIEGIPPLSEPPVHNPLKKIKPNHAFNLIEEADKLYIYDSTNLLFYTVANPFSAKLESGTGKNKLYPYQSYSFCLTKEDDDMLDRLFKDKCIPSPYTKEDFRIQSDINIEIIDGSKSLLNDFYCDAKANLVKISEETTKIAKTLKR